MAGGGIAGTVALPPRGGRQAGATKEVGWWGWVEGEREERVEEESGMMWEEGKNGNGLWPRPDWEEARHVMIGLLPPSSQFHFHGL